MKMRCGSKSGRLRQSISRSDPRFGAFCKKVGLGLVAVTKVVLDVARGRQLSAAGLLLGKILRAAHSTQAEEYI